MTHFYRWPNNHADVFISNIDDTSVTYQIRNKDTGILHEPKRIAKYIVDELNGMVLIDNRSMPIAEFKKAYELLNS